MMVITFMKAKSISFFHIQNRDSKISSESNFNINEQNETANNSHPKIPLAITLFLLSPTIAEFPSGSAPPAEFLQSIRVSSACILYGVGAVPKISSKDEKILGGAGGGIRTHEPLRDSRLRAAPLTWLGNPRPSNQQNKLTSKPQIKSYPAKT
jgi:hypothetical protein